MGRILGGNPALKRHSTLADLLLGEPEIGERLAAGDAQLSVDEVHVGGLLGDGVLHLDAGVHFYERVLAILADQELDRARIAVAARPPEADRVLAQTVAQIRVEVRRRCYLHDLLVAPLH